MPVQITLTDDQALEIVAQVSKMLAKKEANRKADEAAASRPAITFKATQDNTSNLDNVVDGYGTFKMRVIKEVYSYSKGQTFRTSELHYKTGISAHNISNALNNLRSDGKIIMVKRGTWKVAA